MQGMLMSGWGGAAYVPTPPRAEICGARTSGQLDGPEALQVGDGDETAIKELLPQLRRQRQADHLLPHSRARHGTLTGGLAVEEAGKRERSRVACVCGVGAGAGGGGKGEDKSSAVPPRLRRAIAVPLAESDRCCRPCLACLLKRALPATLSRLARPPLWREALAREAHAAAAARGEERWHRAAGTRIHTRTKQAVVPDPHTPRREHHPP